MPYLRPAGAVVESRPERAMCACVAVEAEQRSGWPDVRRHGRAEGCRLTRRGVLPWHFGQHGVPAGAETSEVSPVL